MKRRAFRLHFPGERPCCVCGRTVLISTKSLPRTLAGEQLARRRIATAAASVRMLMTSFAAAGQRLRRLGHLRGRCARALSALRFQTIISCPTTGQARRDGGAHSSDSGDSDFHFVKTTLVSIPTDTIPLDGAWYEPDGAVRGAVLLFHGNTMNFYVGAPRFLPPVLTRLGLACLAFNRRGHDIMSTRNSRIAGGGASSPPPKRLPTTGSLRYGSQPRGFPDPVVIGHSNGGMLGVRHVADHPRTPALVLLSAHAAARHGAAGEQGRTCSRRIGWKRSPGRPRKSPRGRGRELMLLPGWWYVITAGASSTLVNCRTRSRSRRR